MDESRANQLISGGGTKPSQDTPSAGITGISDGFADAFSGVRALDLPLKSPPGEKGAELISEDESTGINWKTVALAIGIVLMAAIPRLIILFFVTDVDNPGAGWYNDSFHHWQIGYLSKEIGFSQGFLRLWDFKGLEYFWGPIHPVILAGLFWLTGSVDILIPRLLSTFAAAGAIAVFFFTARRYFGGRVAIAAAFLAAVNPIAIFAETAGLAGPIAYLLMLTGLLLWPRHAWWAGVAWGLAGMARAEYWIFGLGLVLVASLTREKTERKIVMAIGWLIPSLAYMRYLQIYTGNAIYPLYWNFLGNVAGTWTGQVTENFRPLTATESTVKIIFAVIFILASLTAIYLLRRREKSLPFLIYGVGVTIFVGLYLGLTPAIRHWHDNALYDRAYVVPFMFIGLLVAVVLFGRNRDGGGTLWRKSIGVLGVILIAGAMQSAWIPILGIYEDLKPVWEGEKALAAQISSVYEGGTIAIPENRMSLTYLLVTEHGIEAQELIGEMYDPFYYFGALDDSASNWPELRGHVANWFSQNNIKLLVFHYNKPNYKAMIQIEPNWFDHVGTYRQGEIEVYAVSNPN